MTPGGPVSLPRMLASLALVTVLAVDSSARGEAIGTWLRTATVTAQPVLVPAPAWTRRA